MSNPGQRQGKDSFILIARELTELTGESTTQLYTWAKQHPYFTTLCGVRQTFFNAIQSRGWEATTSRTSTAICRLKSRPLSCQLRFRATSLVTQFRRDVQRNVQRQVVILWGYETCSQLIHFRVFRGPECEKDDTVLLCEQIPLGTFANFARECAQMVGLPIKQMLLTQRLLELPKVSKNEAIFLGLGDGSLMSRSKEAAAPENALPCEYAAIAGQELPRLLALNNVHPFSVLCHTTNATTLTDFLTDLVRSHNLANAIPRLKAGRTQFQKLIGDSYNKGENNRGWTRHSILLTPFLQEITRHSYLEPEMSLHEVRFFRRAYEDFNEAPGDRSYTDRRHGDTGDN